MDPGYAVSTALDDLQGEGKWMGGVRPWGSTGILCGGQVAGGKRGHWSCYGTQLRVLGVLRRVLGAPHRVLGVAHRVLGVAHRVQGIAHKALGVPHSRVLEGVFSGQAFLSVSVQAMATSTS